MKPRAKNVPMPQFERGDVIKCRLFDGIGEVLRGVYFPEWKKWRYLVYPLHNNEKYYVFEENLERAFFPEEFAYYPHPPPKKS